MNGTYSVGLPQGAVLYYPANADGWTDSEHYDAQNNTWNGHELRVWDPWKLSVDVQQEIEEGCAVISVKNFASEEVSGQFWCAAYAPDGRMLAVGNREVSFEMAEEETIRIPLKC